MDRYRLMLYGLCAGKQRYKRYVRCICMCKYIYIYVSCAYVRRMEKGMATYMHIVYVTIFVYDAITMFITHMYLS